MPNTKNVNSFDEQNTKDAGGKKAKRKRLPQPLRGVANFLNEEKAATEGNFEKLRKLKKKPRY